MRFQPRISFYFMGLSKQDSVNVNSLLVSRCLMSDTGISELVSKAALFSKYPLNQKFRMVLTATDRTKCSKPEGQN